MSDRDYIKEVEQLHEDIRKVNEWEEDIGPWREQYRQAGPGKRAVMSFQLGFGVSLPFMILMILIGATSEEAGMFIVGAIGWLAILILLSTLVYVVESVHCRPG